MMAAVMGTFLVIILIIVMVLLISCVKIEDSYICSHD